LGPRLVIDLYCPSLPGLDDGAQKSSNSVNDGAGGS
jgi:hypothetical protein